MSYPEQMRFFCGTRRTDHLVLVESGGTPGKRNRFREALLWDDPPEYFDGRFVAYTADVPPPMLQAAVPPDNITHRQSMKEAEPQFALIHHQYAQVNFCADA